jgi:hypothetical protein
MEKEGRTDLHSLSEGQRVHYLANLGGLVAIAKLEDIKPDLLLGALCEMARRLPKLSLARVLELQKLGESKLRARNIEKRSFKTWQRAQKTQRFDFTQEEMKQLIARLGGKQPALEKDIHSELRCLLKGVLDGA